MKFLIMRLVFTAIALGTFLGPLGATRQAPPQEDWAWLHQIREQALDIMMPIGGAEFTVVYRSNCPSDLDFREQYFAVRAAEPEPTPRYEAVVRTPRGRSIQKQLLQHHSADRSLTLKALMQKVEMTDLKLNSVSCPAIARRMAALTKVMTVVSDDSRLHLDPIHHRLSIKSLLGEIVLLLHDSENPVTEWATGTYAELSDCGRAELRQPDRTSF